MQTFTGHTLPTKTVRFKKSDWLGIKLNKKKMEMLGWEVISEVEVKAFNGAKALGLGLVFLPLALLGSSKYVDITYQKIAKKI